MSGFPHPQIFQPRGSTAPHCTLTCLGTFPLSQDHTEVQSWSQHVCSLPSPAVPYCLWGNGCIPYPGQIPPRHSTKPSHTHHGPTTNPPSPRTHPSGSILTQNDPSQAWHKTSPDPFQSQTDPEPTTNPSQAGDGPILDPSRVRTNPSRTRTAPAQADPVQDRRWCRLLPWGGG